MLEEVEIIEITKDTQMFDFGKGRSIWIADDEKEELIYIYSINDAVDVFAEAEKKNLPVFAEIHENKLYLIVDDQDIVNLMREYYQETTRVMEDD